jgi:hypothetical protein
LTDGEIEMLMRMSQPEKIKLTSSASDLKEAIQKLGSQHPGWSDSKTRKHVSTCLDDLWRSVSVDTVVNIKDEIDNLFFGCIEFGLDGGIVGDFTADILAPIADAVESLLNTINSMLKKIQSAINSFLDKFEQLINSLSFMFGLDLNLDVGGSLWDCMFKLEFNLGLGIAVVAELEVAVDALFLEAYGLWGLIGIAMKPITLALARGVDLVRELSGGLSIILGIPCITIGIDLPFCIRGFLDLIFDVMLSLFGMLEKGSMNLNYKAHIMGKLIAQMKLGFSFSLDINLSGGLLAAAILTI